MICNANQELVWQCEYPREKECYLLVGGKNILMEVGMILSEVQQQCVLTSGLALKFYQADTMGQSLQATWTSSVLNLCTHFVSSMGVSIPLWNEHNPAQAIIAPLSIQYRSSIAYTWPSLSLTITWDMHSTRWNVVPSPRWTTSSDLEDLLLYVGYSSQSWEEKGTPVSA